MKNSAPEENRNLADTAAWREIAAQREDAKAFE